MKIPRAFPLLAIAGALFFQAAPAAAHGMRVCRDDVQRLCGDEQYSRAGIAACLERHTSELSPACATRYTAMKAKKAAFEKACGADVQKVCATADRGKKTFRCLRDHESALSSTCKEELASLREQRQKHGDQANAS